MKLMAGPETSGRGYWFRFLFLQISTPWFCSRTCFRAIMTSVQFQKTHFFCPLEATIVWGLDVSEMQN